MEVQWPMDYVPMSKNCSSSCYGEMRKGDGSEFAQHSILSECSPPAVNWYGLAIIPTIPLSVYSNLLLIFNEDRYAMLESSI